MSPSANSRGRRAAMAWLLAGTLSAVLGLGGCATPQASDYATQQPTLDLRRYFDGALIGHGLVTDRSGRALQRFTVHITGTWQGDTGTLDEQFSYADGRREQRVWTLQRTADGRWSGRAADVLGEARGESAGHALNWRYTLKLPVDGRVWEINFDDWMFLVDERVLINRAVMSKFGIRVGEVLLSFRKLAPGETL
ncbi:DUF3833 domain-containing protein [Aquabacterium sp. OR-4]|uniref:DUF3833 domain-containing protein n=1 Tax=Aquabacterium sp. OR-4 TaxID=2978127 RepID=UPI0021B185B7|nr:DUF3833 domain-containing protein [Aquabacterium sp. OR-4]MDT7834042.1 DUF3833 domain-containing protein [Aquabacterium sp. OR-4]